jgi:phosphoserine phosphatase RsbU/P
MTEPTLSTLEELPASPDELKELGDSRVDDQMLETLRRIAEARTYPAGSLLTHQGATESTFYVIEDGCAVVSRRLESGEDQILNVLGPLHSFGEMALLDGSPRLATVKTTTESTVLEITADRFKRLLRTDPELALYITGRILSNLRTLDQLAIHDLRTKNLQLQEAYISLQAAQAELVEKERLEREMELAAEMQRNLLPAVLPEFPDYRFASFLAPARQVGGDLYDVQPVDDDHVAILIADVADKGMHAALLMAVTRTLFFQESKRSLSPAEVTIHVHQGLLAVGGAVDGYGIDAFVTAFYGVLHRPSGWLHYVRAAQDRPLLLKPNATPLPLPGDGRFLGMIEDLRLQEYSIRISPGDFLLLYSDGVTDALDETGQNYGVDRLTKAFVKSAGGPAKQVLNGIIRDINNWRGKAAAFDDVTMLMVEAIDQPPQ